MGCSSLPFASPSIVRICCPSAASTSVRHETTRRPSTSTVQAPHCPWSQPFLVPVRPMCSRSASSTVVRESTFSDLLSPLTRSVTLTGSEGSWLGMVLVTGAAAFATSGETAVPAAPAMNARRLNPDVAAGSVVSVMMASAAGWPPPCRLTGKKDSCSDGASRRCRQRRSVAGSRQLVDAEHVEAGRCRFLGIGRAELNGVIVVKSLFTVNAGDHKSAILRISPDIHFGRKGAAQLGVIFKQRIWHQTLRYPASGTKFPRPVPGNAHTSVNVSRSRSDVSRNLHLLRQPTACGEGVRLQLSRPFAHF